MTSLPKPREQWAIACLVPDLPPTAAIIPYLKVIDKNRWYTNFGPLQRDFEQALSRYIAAKDSHQLSIVTLSSATLALELIFPRFHGHIVKHSFAFILHRDLITNSRMTALTIVIGLNIFNFAWPVVV